MQIIANHVLIVLSNYLVCCFYHSQDDFMMLEAYHHSFENGTKESESYLAYPPSISSHTSQKRTGDIGTGLSVNFCDSWEMVTTSRGLQLRKPQTGGGRTVLPSWESWGKHCIWTFEIIETLQVPRSKLKEELLNLRRSGYTLLGVEQTHTSVPLDQHWT